MNSFRSNEKPQFASPRKCRLLASARRAPDPRAQVGGFTLVEVVAGLLLMASVLVSSLLAFSAHRQQSRTADAKLAAVRVAEDLLLDFTARQDGIPVGKRGRIAGTAGWFWRTTVVGTTAPVGVPLKVIRLQVIEVSGNRSVPLATVDVLEPLQR